LVASSTTVSTAQTLGTLRIDTTAAAVGTGGAGGSMTITGSNSLSLSSSSKNGLMFDGSGNYTINGTGSLSAIGIYQYSSGTVTVNSAWGTSTRIDKFGPGLFVNNTATAFASSGSLGLDLWEGVYRAGTANAVSGGGRLNFGGGILELTSGSSDFTRTLGTGTTNVNFIGDGGFSAFGGTRAVSIGGTVTPSNLVWSNTGSFLGNGNKLLLSSSTSDSTIDFQNSIDFNGVQREVSVGNGGASIDALLSGKLTTDNYAGGGLYKSGAGTLAITGSANTYAGGTSIVAGKVIAGTGTANTNGNLGSGNVAVWSAGTVLELDNANSIADTSSLILGNGTNLTLNFTGVGYEKVASVTIDGVLFNGPTIFTSSNLNGVNASYFTFADSTSGLQVVPEPTGLAFLGLGAGALLARRRRYRGN
jgi:autotransporter-associated beta strand protein